MRVGGNAGGAWGRDAISTTNTFPVPPFLAVDNAAVSSAASPTVNSNGFLGGVQAGYNLQQGQWLFGVEADFDYMGLRGSNGGTFPFASTLPGGAIGPPTSFFSTAASVSTNWLFTLRPRVGWVVNNWLVYATGGLAVAEEKFSQTITFLPPFVSTNSFTTTRVGWTVGGGVEYGIDQHWSVKGEYLYVDLGTAGGSNGVITPAIAGYFNTSTAHLTVNIARAGINYRF
jgi:outer membrane immunogenic protein